VDAWYATIDGKQVRLADGAGSKEEAYLEFHRIKARQGEVEAEKKTSPLDGIADMYIAKVLRKQEPSSANASIEYIDEFVKAVGRKTPSLDVKPFDVSHWLEPKKWNHNTRAKAQRAIKRMFAWAKEQGYLGANPLAAMKTDKTTVREAYITPAQADAALAATKKPYMRDLLVALRETGCRPKEVWTLTGDRVDLDAKTWQVIDKNRHRTGRKHRTVYLSTTMVELSRILIARYGDGVLFRTSEGEPWSRESMGHAFRRLRKKMTYGPEFIPYAYRSLFITDALVRGVNPATVAELVGHANLKMIMRCYSKLKHRTDHLREAVEQATRRTPSVDRPAE
jgi:integrase